MKYIIILASIFTFSQQASADVYVHGYTKSNGTYVQPHMRSNPDNTRANNWSTQGNVNPYTGQTGTQPAYHYFYGGNQ